MTYLIASLDEILRFLVGPFLSWPFFREVYQLMRWLLLTLFTMWRPVPGGCGRDVPVKPQRFRAIIGRGEEVQPCVVPETPCLEIPKVGGG